MRSATVSASHSRYTTVQRPSSCWVPESSTAPPPSEITVLVCCGVFDGLRHGPGFNFAEGVFAPAGENVGDGAVAATITTSVSTKARAQLLGELLSDGRLADGHGADQDDGPARRSAVLVAGRHYWPIESRDAGMLSR